MGRNVFAGNSRQRLLHRDDLRTRSDASGSPQGSMGRNSRERREDGADDHPNEQANSESVLGESAAEAQSPRGAAASKVNKKTPFTSRARIRKLHRRFWILT